MMCLMLLGIQEQEVHRRAWEEAKAIENAGRKPLPTAPSLFDDANDTIQSHLQNQQMELRRMLLASERKSLSDRVHFVRFDDKASCFQNSCIRGVSMRWGWERYSLPGPLQLTPCSTCIQCTICTSPLSKERER